MTPVNQPQHTLPKQGISPIYIGRLASSPIGPLWVAMSDQGLMAVDWSMPQAGFVRKLEQQFHCPVVYDNLPTAEPLQQLDAYFHGDLYQFTIPLDLSHATPFQQCVLNLTVEIPYGQTSTYHKIASQAGRPNAARAVGRVEATNPIPIIIPCHRVLGSDGSLHGYGGPGGTKLKAWLLQLEQSLNK